jgi:hypothetical protein
MSITLEVSVPELIYILIAIVFIVLQGPLWYKWHGFGKYETNIIYLKETLLNTLGSIVGWAAGYYLIFIRIGNGFNDFNLNIADLAIFIIAFYGMVGQLPNTMINKLKIFK